MVTMDRANWGDGSGGIDMAESTERFAGNTAKEITTELVRFLQETLERDRRMNAHGLLQNVLKDEQT